MSLFLKNALRWVAILPVVYLVYAAMVLIVSLLRGEFFDVDKLSWFGAISYGVTALIAGYYSTKVGAYTAPSRRKIVAYILFSFWVFCVIVGAFIILNGNSTVEYNWRHLSIGVANSIGAFFAAKEGVE